MSNIAAQLSRTFSTCTAKERTVFILFNLCTANRTIGGQMISKRALRSLGKIYLQDFGDDFTGLADQDGISNPDIPLCDKILIVKRGIGDSSTGQADCMNDCFGC